MGPGGSDIIPQYSDKIYLAVAVEGFYDTQDARDEDPHRWLCYVSPEPASTLLLLIYTQDKTSVVQFLTLGVELH